MDVKNLLKKYGISPSKRLGQNFLVDERALKKIVDAANLSKDDVVLEIGSGIGNLTIELAKKAKRVIAVEKDIKMCKILKELLECWNVKNVEIVNEDILKLKSEILNLKSYKLVANLPYYIVSPVIRKFLESENPPIEMILMVQKEVAQRICAKPPDMNLLAVSVQFYAKPKIISFVSKNSFWPRPNIDSAIIKILNLKSKILNLNKDLFFKIVKTGFSQPRKQIINNLSKGLSLEREEVRKWILESGISPTQRAETLKIDDWLKLVKSFG